MITYSIKKCKTKRGYVAFTRPSHPEFHWKEKNCLENYGARWDVKENAYILPLNKEYIFNKLISKGLIR